MFLISFFERCRNIWITTYGTPNLSWAILRISPTRSTSKSFRGRKGTWRPCIARAYTKSYSSAATRKSETVNPRPSSLSPRTFRIKICRPKENSPPAVPLSPSSSNYQNKPPFSQHRPSPAQREIQLNQRILRGGKLWKGCTPYSTHFTSLLVLQLAEEFVLLASCFPVQPQPPPGGHGRDNIVHQPVPRVWVGFSFQCPSSLQSKRLQKINITHPRSHKDKLKKPRFLPPVSPLLRSHERTSEGTRSAQRSHLKISKIKPIPDVAYRMLHCDEGHPIVPDLPGPFPKAGHWQRQSLPLPLGPAREIERKYKRSLHSLRVIPKI